MGVQKTSAGTVAYRVWTHTKGSDMNAGRIVSSRLHAEIGKACSLYRLSQPTVKTILILPIVIFVVYCVLLSIPLTRYHALWMLQEGHPVEWMTFALLLATAVYGVALTMRTRRHHGGAASCRLLCTVFCWRVLYCYGRSIVGTVDRWF